MNTPGRSGEVDSSQGRFLVLMDRLDKKAIPSRQSAFLRALAEAYDPVVVAECYRKPPLAFKRLPYQYETYGFPTNTYDRDVRRFSFELVKRFSPSAVIALGWRNAQLVYELFRRRLPVIMFIDDAPSSEELVEHVKWSSQFADRVFITQEISQYLPLASSEKVEFVTPLPQAPSFWQLFSGRRNLARREAARATVARLLDASRQTQQRLAGFARQLGHDAEIIRASRKFNKALFVEQGEEEYEDPIERYLFDSSRCIPRSNILAGRRLRRPVEGFHPLVYATECVAFDERVGGEDPLAHFLRSGCPEGAWAHQIIRELSGNQFVGKLQSALHIHMHYPELLSDLLPRVQANDTMPNLFITTTSEDRRTQIEKILREQNISATSLVCEAINKGRDIYPFIKLLKSGAFDGYDLVGHLHGKRSPGNARGEDWRAFLWRHLIGSPEKMLDSIVYHFEADAKLGLVIPEDPHLESWGENLDVATALASTMGVPLPLPHHFEFPQGTMFWARPLALAPLLDLDLSVDMLPPEPLANDGTILHAIERLIPFAVAKAGFRTAATHVPSSTW